MKVDVNFYWLGWAISGSTFSVSCLVFAFRAYFCTLKWIWVNTLLVLCALASHVAVHYYAYVQLVSVDSVLLYQLH